MAIRYLNYSGLTRDSVRIHHFANQFQPWKVMRSLVAVLFLAGAAEVVDTPFNRTESCQCTLWSFRPFQRSSFEGDLVMGKARPPSKLLKDDRLLELYSPTQSMSLDSRFSRSIRSLLLSSFFISLRISVNWARYSTYILCYKLFWDNLFIRKLSNNLTYG